MVTSRLCHSQFTIYHVSFDKFICDSAFVIGLPNPVYFNHHHVIIMTHDVIVFVFVGSAPAFNRIVFSINFYTPAVQLIRERINEPARSIQHGIHVFGYYRVFNQVQLRNDGLVVSDHGVKRHEYFVVMGVVSCTNEIQHNANPVQ